MPKAYSIKCRYCGCDVFANSPANLGWYLSAHEDSCPLNPDAVKDDEE